MIADRKHITILLDKSKIEIMKSQIKPTLFFRLVAFFAAAQKKALESVTENELKAHLQFIASDYMQGRNFGTPVPGLELTADYLKAQCLKMNLKPGSTDYFQMVEMVSVKSDPENTVFKLNFQRKYFLKNVELKLKLKLFYFYIQISCLYIY